MTCVLALKSKLNFNLFRSTLMARNTVIIVIYYSFDPKCDWSTDRQQINYDLVFYSSIFKSIYYVHIRCGIFFLYEKRSVIIKILFVCL